MSSDEPFYFYLRQPDDSWIVKKYESIDGELKKEYEVSPSGQCTCKGFKYNNHCKHVESIVRRFTGNGIEPEKAREVRDSIRSRTGERFGYEYKDWIMNNDLNIVGIEFDVNNPPNDLDATMMWGRHESGLDIRFNLSRQAVA